MNVSLETVRRWIRSGELLAQKHGKEYLVTKKDMKEFLTAKNIYDPSTIQHIEEKKGRELVSTYLMQKEFPLKGEIDKNHTNRRTNLILKESEETIQQLQDVETEILQVEIKILKKQEDLLILKKKAIELKLSLY